MIYNLKGLLYERCLGLARSAVRSAIRSILLDLLHLPPIARHTPRAARVRPSPGPLPPQRDRGNTAQDEAGAASARPDRPGTDGSRPRARLRCAAHAHQARDLLDRDLA